MMPFRVLVGVGIVTCLLLALGTLNRTGRVIGNASPSVPRGLYLRADPDRATYVTFCLGHRHHTVRSHATLCAPGSPDAPRILKRIAARHEGGRLTVAGDTARALDSRILGPLAPEQIRGWWRPLILIDTDPPQTRRARERTDQRKQSRSTPRHRKEDTP
ncbi:hypothetical protein [Ruegeria sp.]|uniref:hypothetical protein n=1 Tax=Ruegeria sp. TaxID=1879320 RepID=UPI003AFF6982